MVDLRPGLNPRRMVLLCREAVRRCALDLRGRVVYTEAASGAYVVTPLLAALAGADYVYAQTRATRYGSLEEVSARTLEIARLLGVADRISIIAERSADALAQADIVTNSGHVRPLDADLLALLRPGTAIPLMYESWELRPEDLDLAMCRARGIRVAGTNERHPAVDVFSYLGVMALKQLHDAGVAGYGCKVLVLCDNEFGPYVERTLRAAGAEVQMAATLHPELLHAHLDAILVALKPQPEPVLAAEAATLIAEYAPATPVLAYWGDLDWAAFAAAGVALWPPYLVPAGHMAILPSAVGPEAIVRLQSGGLKVGEVLLRGDAATAAERAFIDEVLA